MTETLDSISFSLDAEQIIAQAHLEAESRDAEDLLSLIELAQAVGKPKAVYAVCFIGLRDGDAVQIDDVRFKSRMLARNLGSVERVFPHVATCGHELDEAFPGKGDMLKEYWWDLIKSRLLGAANKHLTEHLHRKFRLGKTVTMHPGSGDASVWPIEQQKDLFMLLGDVEGAIGVRLTESFLMIPNKTTSGLMFATETDFRSCEVCHRENCPSRHAPFNKQLWAEIQHD
jgi:hypothetical protein